MKKPTLPFYVLFAFLISCYLCKVVDAIPQRINYQAVLKNKTTGQILPDGNYTISFRLYSAATGGAALWAETAPVTITNGILAHQLGSVTTINLPFDQGYYLGVQVAGDSEMTPREELVSLGYAFVAQNAEMLNGYNPGNSSGNISLNNGTLNTNLNADKLDSQHGSFYQNASNLSSGILPSGRLVGSYTSTSVAYATNADNANNAVNATNATNADTLDGQHGSSYQDATNLNAGIIAADRLRNYYSYTSTTVAHYAFNANNLGGQPRSYYQDATNLKTGILPEDRLVGSYSSASVAFADSALGAGLRYISSAPYIISQPGSYILLSNLTTVTNQTAITILCSNVTLDLNGNTLYGAGTTSGSTGYGVYSYTSCNSIQVRNGNAVNFLFSGIHLYGDSNQITDICAYGNGLNGIDVSSNCIIKNNITQYNGFNGIYAGMGCLIINNACSNNGSSGIVASNACTIIGNSMAYNNFAGISAPDYVCTITHNSAFSNKEYGISAGTENSVIENTCRYSKIGIKNLGDCQVIGNLVSYCLDTAYGYGIYCTGQRSRIDSNHITNNRIGIDFSNSKNWYGRNTFSGNTASDIAGSVPASDTSTQPFANRSF
ncbi:MAG: hypothetical protein ACE14V_08970 [bacterium]